MAGLASGLARMSARNSACDRGSGLLSRFIRNAWKRSAVKPCSGLRLAFLRLGLATALDHLSVVVAEVSNFVVHVYLRPCQRAAFPRWLNVIALSSSGRARALSS